MKKMFPGFAPVCLRDIRSPGLYGEAPYLGVRECEAVLFHTVPEGGGATGGSLKMDFSPIPENVRFQMTGHYNPDHPTCSLKIAWTLVPLSVESPPKGHEKEHGHEDVGHPELSDLLSAINFVNANGEFQDAGHGPFNVPDLVQLVSVFMGGLLDSDCVTGPIICGYTCGYTTTRTVVSDLNAPSSDEVNSNTDNVHVVVADCSHCKGGNGSHCTLRLYRLNEIAFKDMACYLLLVRLIDNKLVDGKTDEPV